MSNQPSTKFRIGLVTATVWENKSDNDKVFYNTTIVRSYKDGDDYKNTDTFSHSDLLNAAQVLTRAEAWIAEQA